MDETVLRTMLFDFYGDLLTAKQRECFDLHYNEDLSLAEIAAMAGITRQGVWDNIRRAETSLREMEDKTGLIRRFERQRETVTSLRTDLEALCKSTSGAARNIVRRALEKLSALEG